MRPSVAFIPLFMSLFAQSSREELNQIQGSCNHQERDSGLDGHCGCNLGLYCKRPDSDGQELDVCMDRTIPLSLLVMGNSSKNGPLDVETGTSGAKKDTEMIDLQICDTLVSGNSAQNSDYEYRRVKITCAHNLSINLKNILVAQKNMGDYIVVEKARPRCGR
ncbi:hypothetical protein CONPUDRAFT_77896 [Coniophora puteana RWD-64-598 SS2]|uniref:Cyanovirin-N domain-containing protein n=1 Tax=Coniophora puteana (strain RWD-64-598) TaxID=741705 RepID=R7SEL2_CONPW|nr:uncharacterized protein CONPUDRAFT_77896 [Coniophora puteana RWD-64-598 SS2]EIW74613.1 hypothetical protein CONPUDRAFT_77896 [Coniophora puteana RWD-64-598 SS2]